MLRKLRAILAEINRPSAQRDGWFLWASVQLAHVTIGAVLCGSLSFVVAPIWAFTGASIGYALVKEVPDFLQSRTWANARDCVQDSLFVTSGAAAAVSLTGSHEVLFLVSTLATLVGLLLGTLDRIKDSPE